MCSAASRTSRSRVGSPRATSGADVGDGRRRRRSPPPSRRAIAPADATASMQPTLPQTHRTSGPPRTRTCPMSPAAPSAPWCSSPAPVIRPPPMPGADLDEQQRRLVRGQRPGLAERAQVDVVLQHHRAAERAAQARGDGVGVPAGHDRRPHRDAVQVRRPGRARRSPPPARAPRRAPCARSARSRDSTASSTGVRALARRRCRRARGPACVWLRSTTARCAPCAPRSATSTCPPRGESASRSAGRPRPGVARVPATRTTPRWSSSSTAALTVVRAMPGRLHEVGLACAAPDATSRASVLSVTAASRRADEGGRAEPQQRQSAATASRLDFVR